MIFTELSNQVEALEDIAMTYSPPLRVELTEILLQHLEKTLSADKARQCLKHLKTPYMRSLRPNSKVLIVDEYAKLFDIIYYQ